MHARRVSGKSLLRSSRLCTVAFLLLVITTGAPALAQDSSAGIVQEFGARTILLMLFLMLGPVKVLVPFANMTHSCDAVFRRRLATRAILFSAAALGIAGALGRSMLDNLNISIPVLALTGGVVLFLVALRTILEQSSGRTQPKETEKPAGFESAFNPLAFPIIVTPYGIAAVIVFATIARDSLARLTVAAIVLGILMLDLLAMLFADVVLRWFGTALQVFAVVLGVTQVALGLQVIARSLSLIGLLPASPH
jgi:multiple antibiotic resistance protein